ncbi:MAG: hypothetical protein J7L47_03150 [Candidatus Odinarchaeota archaeon]|nr:hypothetical protein [Candidatus Odinarchaeota archaeon]
MKIDRQLLLENKKTISFKAPQSVYEWIKQLADKKGTNIGAIVLGWVLDKFENESIESAESPAPGKGLQAEKSAEDKNFKEEGAAEKGPVILDANYFYKVLGHWPHMAKKDVLLKLLKSKGVPEIKAKVLINTIVSEGIYEERNGKLYLRKEAVA